MHRTTCSKIFADFPFAHRQHNHDGHCALIHGHNWAFRLTFEADTLEDGTEFVVDFGKLKWIKEWLCQNFDHTLVLNANDPHLDYLKAVLCMSNMAERQDITAPPVNFAKLVVVPNCGAEGLARWILEELNAAFAKESNGVPADWVKRNVRVRAVEVLEDERNSATVTAGHDLIKKLKRRA